MLDAENDGLAASGGPTPYTHQWKLDLLGNWRGTGTVPGLKQTSDFDGDGYPDDRTIWHVVGKAPNPCVLTSQSCDQVLICEEN